MQRFLTLTRLSARPSLPALHPQSYRRFAKMSAPKAAETDTKAKKAVNKTGVTSESITMALELGLGAQHVELKDMSGGCGQLFHARIVSSQFEKKNMLARHRLVNSTLKAEIAIMHGWSPQCFTPDEWAKKQEEMPK